MLFNLFALTSDPAKRIVRFELSSTVQDDLTTYIKNQENEFELSTEVIPFDGKYKPDSGDVLLIDNYDDIDNLSNAILNPISIEVVEPTESFFGYIKALFTGYTLESGEVKVLLQNFDKRRIISTNGLSIFHSSNVYKKIEGIGLTVDSKLTAILEGRKLRFFSFFTARQMFDLSGYYKEATNEDINVFSSSDAVHVISKEGLIEISDSWVRRKISLIQQSDILGTVPIHTMKAVASKFNIPFPTVNINGNEVIDIPLDKPALKVLLRFLDEDYYKSPLSNTNFVTNSKRECTF
ncbi:Kiwa anti-phage protein KwaB-like domain-containing protein [Photobacterium leiognathi]|uniref:Kiwa anti-phage protein KwaB-like domain-containing protein n=1 Tax=Photobacterium leiognathi TaxID=553611 RepID=UPI0029818077|nr:Kiwa anti-phage protein KwaB-like domain-containing protein [Photobacterium leiognathi]